MDRCQSCGFTYELDRPAETAAVITATAQRIADILTERSADSLRARPDPETWSALEYACHVRDVLMVQRERLLAARCTDQPSPPPMGRDERVEYDGYNEQAPADVARQLVDAELLLTNALSRLSGDDRERTLIYSYPEPTVRTLSWLAAQTAHELVHHHLDIEGSPAR